MPGSSLDSGGDTLLRGGRVKYAGASSCKIYLLFPIMHRAGFVSANVQPCRERVEKDAIQGDWHREAHERPDEVGAQLDAGHR